MPSSSKTNFEYHEREKLNPACGQGLLQLGFFMLPTCGKREFIETLTESTQAMPLAQPNPPPPAPALGGVTPAAAPKSTGSPAVTRKLEPAVLSTPSSPTGNAVLVVTSGLTAQAGGQNQLAAHTFVFNQGNEAVWEAAGLQAPAGVSPIKGYLAACSNRQPACQVGIAATNSSTVSGAKADSSGRAQLPGVPPGTYYFFCLGAYNNQLFKWDFQIQLEPGTNAVAVN